MGLDFIFRKVKKNVRKWFRYFVKKLQRVEPIYVPVLQDELLKGRVALITGGTSGIGFAIAVAFVKAGASVIITGRNKDRLEATKLELERNACSRVSYIVMDNSDVSSIRAGIDTLYSLASNTKVDILVNNAGMCKGCFGSTSERDWDDVLDTNLKGTYFLSQEFSNYLKKYQIKGNILNVCSSSSLRPGNSPYILSKWGVRSFTVGLAKTLLPYGIVVNGIAPGPTATPMLGKFKEDEDLSLGGNPSGRYATSAEISNMAVILVSDIGRMVVGDIVYMTGGAGVLTFDDVKYSF